MKRFTCMELPVCLFLSVLMITTLGCSKTSDRNTPQPVKGELIDLGLIPEAVSAFSTSFLFQTAFYDHGSVFIGTTNGVWKYHVENKTWTKTGLAGKSISALFKHPTIPDRYFAGVNSDGTNQLKTLYISTDAGQTWHAAAQPVYDHVSHTYETYVCFAVRPENPSHIYCNLASGTTIAVSTDGGEHWKRMNNISQSYFGYGCAIAFLPNITNKIFQGAEAPLDDAWLASYTINDSDPSNLTEFTKIVGMDKWQFRRPNKLLSFSHTPNTLYAGLEGALAKVEGSHMKFVFYSDNTVESPYIKAIWVDPADSKHILFGGFLNHNVQPMSLYETYDEGQTIGRIENKMGLSDPQVLEIVTTPTYPIIVVNDQHANKVKLLMYKPKK